MRSQQKTYRPRSTALLSSLPPALTLHVHHSSGPWPRSRRTLQLRGPVLQLSKHSVDPEHAQTLLVLSASSAPLAISSTAVSIHPGHKLWFSNTAQRDLFLSAARNAIARSAGGAHRYIVRHEIGHGASGVVRVVERKSDGKLFAMKSVNKIDTFSSDFRLANLVGERVALAEAADRSSAFIVRLVDAFETPEYLCFVTELGSFGDLHGIIQKLPGYRMGEQMARQLFAEIVLGVEETHRMGFLHRDIKLGNFLLNKNGHVRLADLGLAKRLRVEVEDSSVFSASSEDSSDEDEERFRLVGRTTTFVGTKRYMSPEHFKAGRQPESGYGAPADVWAMGIALYIMLTGNYPFGRSVSTRYIAQMFDAVQNEEIEYPAWLSEDAIGMLKGLLERDVLERFDISEIKSHPWMRGVYWAAVREDSVRDVPQEDVIALMHELGLSLIENKQVDSDRATGERDVMSWVSGSSSDSGKRRKQVLPNFELLGFGYLNM